MSENETVYPRLSVASPPRNPAHHERPTFVGVSEYLSQPDSLLLSWKEGDASSGQKARELGAAISESRHLFLDLQHKYK